jgi:branched-chain amino acid transport system ATP-binding protein
MLEISELHSFYGNAHVLQGVSLTVAEGSVLALLGRNGMGKTTLIRSIMGARPPTIRAGSTRFGTHDLVGMPSYDIALLGLGWVPQGRRVFSSLTVLENLGIASRPPQRADDGQHAWDLERVFEFFPRLEERARQRAGQLSGGERQMLAIARALLINPVLLLMDEPSEGLAPRLVQQLGDQLLSLKESGMSIFLVEQNVGLALRVADDAYVIERGKIVYRGSPEDLERDEEAKHKYLGV